MFTREYDKFQYQCKFDECMGLIGTYVTDSLSFHLKNCDPPFKIWEKLEDLFCKVDHMRAIQLEMEISSLNPKKFLKIIDYLTKFKHLLTQLKGSGRYKKDEECV